MPKIFDDSTGPIGSIVSSLLTEAQYQGLYGAGWVLMDGRSCVGSAYAAVTGATTIPDARGMVLRGKNNGRSDGNQNPDGDSALGAFQNHSLASHLHGLGRPDGGDLNNPPYSSIMVGTGGGGFIGNTNSTGGNETRMRNITVNHFIRIN